MCIFKNAFHSFETNEGRQLPMFHHLSNKERTWWMNRVRYSALKTKHL